VCVDIIKEDDELFKRKKEGRKRRDRLRLEAKEHVDGEISNARLDFWMESK
jgi:hypothetical protein